MALRPHFTPQRFLDDAEQFSALRTRAWVVPGPMLDRSDATLATQGFLLGDRRTVVDAYLYVILTIMVLDLHAPDRGDLAAL